MNEVEVFMELIDEKTLNFILSEFFSDNNPKQNVSIKKIKLQKLLREQGTSKMSKKYRKKGKSYLQILKKELADDELLDLDIDEFIGLIISGEKLDLSNLQLFCSANINFPNIIQKNVNKIVQNNKNSEFLFKGVEELILSSKSIESIELNRLKLDFEELKKDIEKIKSESENIKNENKKLNTFNNQLSNENKKLKKDISKNEKEIKKMLSENRRLENINITKENTIIDKENQINDLIKAYENIKKDRDYIYLQHEKLKNREYIEINNERNNGEYTSCIIYTSPILRVRSLFDNILFVSYDKYLKDTKGFIDKLKKHDIKKVYIISGKISMKEIGILKRKIKKEKIDYETLLFSSELDIVKNLIKNMPEEESYNLA